jgi:Tfp pilus assembly protein PilN
MLFFGRHELSLWRLVPNGSELIDRVYEIDAGSIQRLISANAVADCRFVVVLDTDQVAASKLSSSASMFKSFEALTYDAETHFPYTAEEMAIGICGVKLCDDLAVACDLSILNEIADAILASNVSIVGIYCASIVTCQAQSRLISSAAWGADQTKLLKIKRQSGVELLSFQRNGVDWFVENHDVPCDVEIDGTDSMAELVATSFQHLGVGQFEKTWGRLQGNFAWNTRARSTETKFLFLLGAQMMIMLLTVSGAFYFRSLQFQDVIANCESEERRIARDLFPDKARIRSLVRELEGERSLLEKRVADIEAITQADSPLNVVLAVLNALPENPGVNIRDLQVNPSSMTISGRADDLGKVSEMVAILQRSGLSVQQEKFAKDFDLNVKLGKIEN